MPENITTVLNLPDADFGSGGFSNPADNRVYILQGEGSNRDRKVSLGDLFDWLVGAKAMTNESPQHRVGDIVFKIEDTRGGKTLTAYVMKERTLEKLTVTGGLKADSIEGTNQGQGDTKYLILGNTTVNGDLDVKGKAMLGNSMLVANPAEQTLESSVPLGFGDGYQAGKELVRTDEVKTGSIISGRFKLPKEGDAPYQNISADCFHDTDSDYTLDGGVGSIEYVYNSGTAQIKVILGNRVSDGASLYVYLNAGCCCGFICVSSYDSGHRWAPMFNAVVQVDTE